MRMTDGLSEAYEERQWDVFCENNELRLENDQLRELVRDYDKVLNDAVYVWGTVADFLGYGRKYDSLHNRTMGLGIEVD